MSEYLTKNGNKKLVIGVAPWADAKRLKSAIEKAAASAGVVIAKEANIGQLLNAVLLIDSSEDVDEKMQACLIRCTYDGHKITESTFDKAEARRDYYEIIMMCAEENLRPLVESLHSVLPAGLMTFLMKAKEKESAQG